MDSLLELNRVNTAREIIRKKIQNTGRNSIYDLTGLCGGFEICEENLKLIETYVGPAIFSEKLNNAGLSHLSGNSKIHNAVCFNRTSSAILSTIMTMSKSFEKLVHYVPEKPAHPSIPRSCKIFGMEYFESDSLEEIISKIDENSFTAITGATMDHKVVSEEIAKKIIAYAKSKNSPVFFDDASGARLRKLYNESPALEMGADLVVTSMDKLMEGPRAGLLAGDKNLVDQIYSEGLKFGLEAQAPIMAAVVTALESFDLNNLKNAFERAEKVDLTIFETEKVEYKKTPTGFIIKNPSEEKLIETALKLLENYGIVTITAAGMPGASKNIRIDFCSKDAERISDEYVVNAVLNSLK